MWGRQCTAYHRRAKQDECINCGSTLHRTADCGRPKEPRTEKGQGKNEKGEGKGKGDKSGEQGGKTGWKGQSQRGQGGWKGNSKGGEKGKENGKGDEVKNAVKLALEKNKEEEKEKKDKEDEKTKATEKENEAKEKLRQEISDEVSKTVGAEVVKALKTIARAKMLRAVPIEEAKKTIFKPELRSSTGRVCLDSGSDQILRPLFKDEDETNLVGVRVELANGQIVGMQSNEKGSHLRTRGPGDTTICTAP